MTTPYPPPFDTVEGMKRIPDIMHPQLHWHPAISNFVQTFLTDTDATLYSSSFRAHLQSLFQTNSEIQTLLSDPVTTREHLYRFYVKGSNVFLLIEQYLQMKHAITFPSSISDSFESDWDLSILINPALSDATFHILFHQIQYVCLEKLITYSRILSTIPEYELLIRGGLTVAKHHMENDELTTLVPYRGWKLTFKKDTQKKVIVYDARRGRNADNEMVESLGLSGKGTIVRSNYTPFDGSQFYLARLMANVVAGNGILLPVELIDIAIPYKGDELELAWESHSELQFTYNGFDYRILSPVGLYVDLAKTIRNGERSRNNRRTHKLGKRLRRVQVLLDELIRPYSSGNTTIRQNMARLSRSHTASGSAVRAMMQRLENRRQIRSAVNLFEMEEDADAST